jgi:hypothetical protein
MMTPALVNRVLNRDMNLTPMIAPSFGGLSPILPATINTTILNLFQDAMNPGRALSGDARDARGMRRELALEVIHRHFEAQTHQKALALVEAVWSQHLPFCLYLRNFEFGARLLPPVPLSAQGADGRFLVAIDTHVNMLDGNLQRALAARVVPSIPVLGLENAFDVRGPWSVPKLTVGSGAWRGAVGDLIKAAEVILVLCDHISPALAEELTMIAQAKRQPATIVVTPAGALVNQIQESRRLARAGDTWTVADVPETGRSIEAGAFDDFAACVYWDGTAKSVESLASTIQGIPDQSESRTFTRSSPSIPAPRAPANIQAEAHAVIDAGLTLAGAAFKAGRLVEAQDKLSVCFAMASWADIPEARVMCTLWLCRTHIRKGEIAPAVANLERTLDILERLNRAGGPPYLRDVFAEVAAFLDPHRGAEGVAHLIDRMTRLVGKSSADAR